MTSSSAGARLHLLLLLTVLPVAAQESGNAQIKVDIGRDTTLEKEFQLTNAVNCPRDRYRFLLTPDRDFVSLPDDTVELSRPDSTRVSVRFDSKGMEPGIYSANIRIKCRNCGQCDARDKLLRVEMRVLERGMSIEDSIIEQVPDAADPGVTEATMRSNELELQPVIESAGIDGAIADAVRNQQSEARVDIDTGANPMRGVPVPDVTGSRVTEATERLNGLGLQPLMETAGIARADLVTILNQQPEPGVAVDVGTRVSLVPGVPVPDVVGLDRAEAKTRLDELGLLLVIANRHSAGEDLPNVASQVPSANVVVPIGTRVNLVLSGVGRPPVSRVWLPAVVMLLILGTVTLHLRRSPRKRTASSANIDVRSQVDPGTQQVWPDISDRPRAVVRVRLVSDAGEQSLQGDPASTIARE